MDVTPLYVLVEPLVSVLDDLARVVEFVEALVVCIAATVVDPDEALSEGPVSLAEIEEPVFVVKTSVVETCEQSVFCGFVI